MKKLSKQGQEINPHMMPSSGIEPRPSGRQFLSPLCHPSKHVSYAVVITELSSMQSSWYIIAGIYSGGSQLLKLDIKPYCGRQWETASLIFCFVRLPVQMHAEQSRLAAILFLRRANLPRFDVRIWPHFHVKTHKSPLFNTQIGMLTALFNL